MRETIKIKGKIVTIQRFRSVRWPDGKWSVFSGNQESTGPTKEDAIYNFRREHPEYSEEGEL